MTTRMKTEYVASNKVLLFNASSPDGTPRRAGTLKTGMASMVISNRWRNRSDPPKGGAWRAICSYRSLATAIVLATSCAFWSTSAHAQLQLACPAPWQQLGALKDADLNASVLGIKARDWSIELLDQIRSKSEECIRSGSGMASMREAQHADGVSRVYPAAKHYIAEIAQRVQREKTVNQIGSAVQQSDLKQVVTLDAMGQPKSITIIYGSTGRANKTCDTLNGGIGYATEESYGQAVQFARMCQQIGRTPAATVAMLERQAAAQTASLA